MHLYTQMDRNTLKIQFLGVQFTSIFAIPHQLHIFFTLKVLHMEIDIVVHFYGVMKLSEHGQNCQLSYFDHSGYRYINLSFN